MNEFKIPYNKPFIVGKELHNISRAVIEYGHLSGHGEFTKSCHDWLEKNLGCRKALLTHSCTAALEMAAIIVNIQPGDEVIMPSFTFVSTANAFVLRGGVPVFIDIREDTLNLDESLIRSAISERTKAIVPVHYAGVPCDMDTIMKIAKDHGLWVIEDAAQALLSEYKEEKLGSIGHLGCLSFHETKNIISGEGGALLINEKQFMERSEIIWEKGTNRNQFFKGEVDKYTWVDIGSSYLPSELTAGFLLAQMDEAERIIEKRRKLFNSYLENLKDLDMEGKIKLPAVPSPRGYNGHIFYIITGGLEERTRLAAFLKEKGILSVFHYVPLHSSPAGVRFGKTVNNLSVTNDLSNRLLRLPLFFDLKFREVEYVCNQIKTFYSQ